MAEIDSSTVCSRLSIAEKDVLNLYLLGSRLWGTAGPSSDYDFLVVVKDKAPALANSSKSFLNVHSGNFDALIISETLFAEKLTQYSSTYELLATWLPKQYILKQSSDPKSLFKLNRSLLRTVITKTADRDWAEARKYLEKGSVDRCKKTLAHMFRTILLLTQVAENGHISDYEAATNEENMQVLRGMFSKDWPSYEGTFSYWKDELLSRVDELCQR